VLLVPVLLVGLLVLAGIAIATVVLVVVLRRRPPAPGYPPR
jgi:hypothetical protein